MSADKSPRELVVLPKVPLPQEAGRALPQKDRLLQADANQQLLALLLPAPANPLPIPNKKVRSSASKKL